MNAGVYRKASFSIQNFSCRDYIDNSEQPLQMIKNGLLEQFRLSVLLIDLQIIFVNTMKSQATLMFFKATEMRKIIHSSIDKEIP
ncbi:hypothetical protein CKO50_18280 [Pseudoalteromonas sp. HM-SA03]|uniref:hypothetical protein n=1 Tax=Pseudoalteromonas sp. HM-SA03 TaxID=2029678 RepID=UPI000BAE6298|nr:hypothetical protein [Pseudoalteromonas sp. HM-SA03]PAX99997.1 hypothetical protein CKO50_18280 [Pseudoalteromonas sp. HM-SA03]